MWHFLSRDLGISESIGLRMIPKGLSVPSVYRELIGRVIIVIGFGAACA